MPLPTPPSHHAVKWFQRQPASVGRNRGRVLHRRLHGNEESFLLMNGCCCVGHTAVLRSHSVRWKGTDRPLGCQQDEQVRALRRVLIVTWNCLDWLLAEKTVLDQFDRRVLALLVASLQQPRSWVTSCADDVGDRVSNRGCHGILTGGFVYYISRDIMEII